MPGGIESDILSPQAIFTESEEMFMEELNALKKQINLPLFRGLMGFIIDTIKADGSQQRILRSRCMIPFSCANGEDFQKKYGFLYLGELLERYEERFGMGRPDLRAIALALGRAFPRRA